MPLKYFVATSCHLYFRKLRATGLKNIPKKGPVIYSMNHQNALLDPLVIHSISVRNPYFLTRGDVFSNKYVDKLLRGFKMLPIYRIRDGYDSLKMNEGVFESIKEILTKGGIVGIFPEGSHSLLYKLRPLKKGIARIAFRTEEASGFKANVQIVPIGFRYESPTTSKGRTLVSFGKPIHVADYKEIYLQDQNKAISGLLKELSSRMRPLILNIDTKDYDRVYKTFVKKRVFKNNLKKQLKADQALVDSIMNGVPFVETSDKSNFIVSILKRIARIIWNAVHYIPKSMIDYIVDKNVKDLHFKGTARFAYSMIIYPAFFISAFFIIRYLITL